MPLTHSTAKDPGDFGSGTYSHCKIVSYTMNLENNSIQIVVKHGSMVDGNFVPTDDRNGQRQSINISGAEYATLVGANQSTYDAAKAALYAELVANHGFAGTVS